MTAKDGGRKCGKRLVTSQGRILSLMCELQPRHRNPKKCGIVIDADSAWRSLP